jgi:hypothetical protein
MMDENVEFNDELQAMEAPVCLSARFTNVQVRTQWFDDGE